MIVCVDTFGRRCARTWPSDGWSVTIAMSGLTGEQTKIRPRSGNPPLRRTVMLARASSSAVARSASLPAFPLGADPSRIPKRSLTARIRRSEASTRAVLSAPFVIPAESFAWASVWALSSNRNSR